MDTLGILVLNTLKTHGVKRNSKSWTDYMYGKELIAGMELSPADYYRACQIIADYLGL